MIYLIFYSRVLQLVAKDSHSPADHILAVLTSTFLKTLRVAPQCPSNFFVDGCYAQLLILCTTQGQKTKY